MHRLHPKEFDGKIHDPWSGVTLKRRAKKTKLHVTRDQVYKFAWGCIERNMPEPAAAAVICYEWLQRPENVLAGKIRWTDYRSKDHSNQIRIEHHKTGKQVLHPLEEMTENGLVLFYEEAESVLSHLPRRGVPMILREVVPSKSRPNDPVVCKPFSFSGFEKIVQRMRKEIGMPQHFTLDACRHGGMTELEEAELADGKAEPSPRTQARPTTGTQSVLRSEHWRRHVSVTPMCWRTRRKRLFRMRGRPHSEWKIRRSASQ